MNLVAGVDGWLEHWANNQRWVHHHQSHVRALLLQTEGVTKRKTQQAGDGATWPKHSVRQHLEGALKETERSKRRRRRRRSRGLTPVHVCVYTQTDTQTHRHTDTQTHRHTDTQTDTHTHRGTLTCEKTFPFSEDERRGLYDQTRPERNRIKAKHARIHTGVS